MITEHSLLLHKFYNHRQHVTEWISLYFQHQFSIWHGNLIVPKTSTFKIGKNILFNRLSILNNKIAQDWLNLSFEGLQLRVKNKFL
jgi:hypothetical protein